VIQGAGVSRNGERVHVVIAGCGRVGSQLARELASSGHDIVIVDKDRRAFRRLGDDFDGRALHGVVFDRGTLEEAGIKRAQAFVAVTSGDNSNIVSARAAREAYGVERVVARIYDPTRARIFERLGITTVASAQWTAEEVLRTLLPPEERVAAALGPGHGDVVLVAFPVPAGTSGVAAQQLDVAGKSVLAAVTREGRTNVPVAGGLLRSGDLVHLAVQREALEELRAKVAELGKDGA
jgi:trk system potassium uptake protein